MSLRLCHAQAAICIAVVGGIVGYAAFFTFSHPCKPTLGILPVDITSDNIFQAKDGEMIAVFILDTVACIMLLSAAANVARRAM